MDSILGTNRKKIDAIKETIRNKKMTADEISSYLSQIIQAEMKKPLAEMDEALVKECEDILWQLNSDTDYVSHANESKKEVMDKLSGNQQHKFFSRRATVVICAALVLVCLVGLIDAAFHFEWLTGSSTKDEQQYVINGVTVDPKLVVNGNAEDSNNTYARLDTSDMDEVTALLGYTPDTPTWMPNGLSLDHYVVGIFQNETHFAALYVNDDNTKHFTYSIAKFNSADSANIYFEQNCEGEMISVDDFHDLYVFKNTEYQCCVWIFDLSVYALDGRLTEDEIIKIAISTKGD